MREAKRASEVVLYTDDIEEYYGLHSNEDYGAQLMDMFGEDEPLTEDEVYENFADDKERTLIELDSIALRSRLFVYYLCDIGRWNGRVTGIRGPIKAESVGDIIYGFAKGNYDADHRIVIDKNNDIVDTSSHHDGSNYVVARIMKDNLTERQEEIFENKVENGTLTEADWKRYTQPLGDYIIDLI